MALVKTCLRKTELALKSLKSGLKYINLLKIPDIVKNQSAFLNYYSH